MIYLIFLKKGGVKAETYSFFIVAASRPLSTIGVFCVVL